MRRRYLIAGRVQAVGFRYFARRLAVRLGVAGWVRNLPDGRVESEAEGPPSTLDAFESELRQGPSGAVVAEFAVTEISDEDSGVSGFAIR